jgi:hypothetical protein
VSAADEKFSTSPKEASKKSERSMSRDESGSSLRAPSKCFLFADVLTKLPVLKSIGLRVNWLTRRCQLSDEVVDCTADGWPRRVLDNFDLLRDD